jgi:plasmid stability protein
MKRNSVITVRDIDPGDKSWVRREAEHHGVSMEEYVRRLIHEKRKLSEGHQKPSAAFRRYFGAEHGVELPLTRSHGYRPVSFSEDDER